MKLYTATGKEIDLTKGIDCAIPLTNSATNLSAWSVNTPRFDPVMENGWVGLVAKGGSVNFRNIFFNPHGHGTHTECLGHITSEIHSVNRTLKIFFFEAVLVSIVPERKGDDQIITAELLESSLVNHSSTDALIIRTLPNLAEKKHKNYTASNPPYLAKDCIEIINKLNVKHLLVDLPSVDKEDDGGETAFHHTFWEIPSSPRFDRTITELIFVPDEAKDGEYLLNLQMAAIENDAAPSRPVLYPFS